MQQIVVEPKLVEVLSQQPDQVLLCDSEGRALGFFSPLSSPTLTTELQLEPTLSLAEIEVLRQDRGGKPLEEILRRLGVE